MLPSVSRYFSGVASVLNGELNRSLYPSKNFWSVLWDLYGLPFFMHGGIFFSGLPVTQASHVWWELFGQLRGDVARQDAAVDKRGVGLDLPGGAITPQGRWALELDVVHAVDVRWDVGSRTSCATRTMN